MKILSVLALAMGISASAQAAETITCRFTEPFIDLKIFSDMATEDGPNGNEVFLVSAREEVGDQILVKYVGVDSAHTITMKKDGEGSDGMSERVFPYSALRDGVLHGGCETESEKSHNPFVDSAN